MRLLFIKVPKTGSTFFEKNFKEKNATINGAQVPIWSVGHSWLYSTQIKGWRDWDFSNQKPGVYRDVDTFKIYDEDRLVTIVTDSVAAASTKAELASDYGKDGYATDKAIIISKAMRKITNLIGRQKITLVFTNQLRQKMNAMPFSDPWTTSGGKAIAFHASVRLRLKSMGTIKVKESSGDRIVGIKVRCQVVKNRMGPPLRSADFDIFFDRGIDNYGAWLAMMKDNKILTQGGAWYTYVDIETGEEFKFQAKDFPELMQTNKELEEQIYKRICEATILQYKKDSLDTDNLVTDSEVIGD